MNHSEWVKNTISSLIYSRRFREIIIYCVSVFYLCVCVGGEATSIGPLELLLAESEDHMRYHTLSKDWPRARQTHYLLYYCSTLCICLLKNIYLPEVLEDAFFQSQDCEKKIHKNELRILEELRNCSPW